MKKTWRQWWRWTVQPKFWRLKRRIEYRRDRVLARVWPWSVLVEARLTASNARREVASMEHVLGAANKTIAEFQHRLYVLGDKSALDQRDPRLWDPKWSDRLAASIENWIYEADCLEEVDPRKWSDRLRYLKRTLDRYVRKPV